MNRKQISLFSLSLGKRGFQKKYQLPDGILFTANQLEEDIINSKFLKRLTEIKQLGLAYLVFPGANHTRFEHSLGSAHYATLMLDNLMAKYSIVLQLNEQEVHFYRQKLRLEMLMHDTGHGPGGHLFERAVDNAGFYFKHEKQTAQNWRSSVISKILQKNAFNLDFKQPILEGIIEQIKDSVIDADKIDYLQRDAFFCGVNVRIDINRLIDRLELSFTDNGQVNLALEEGGLDAFTEFYNVRKRLYKSIYYNKNVVILEKHLEEVFIKAISSKKELNKIKNYSDINMMMFLKNKKHKDLNATALEKKKPFSIVAQIYNDDEFKMQTIKNALVDKIGKKNVIDVELKTANNQLLNYSFNIVSKRYNFDKPIQEVNPLFNDFTRSKYWYLYVNPDNYIESLEIVKSFDY